MSQLEFVNPESFSFLNVLLYGPPKTGKTVGASTAPGPILYLNADPGNATRYAHQMAKAADKDIFEVQARGLSSLIAVADELQQSSADYGAVVVDPIGDLYRIVLEDLSGRALSPQIQQYGDTGTHIERFCRALCDLPTNVIFVCHEISSKDEEAGHFERLPFTGTNNPAFGAKLMAMVDVIGYTGVITEEGKETRYVAQLFNGGGRRGGDRTGALGMSRNIDIGEWVKLAEEQE